MQKDVENFDVPMRGYTLHASYFGPRERTALLLHGGGDTSSADIFPLRVDLAERGIGTLALDHRGHGLTGGSPEESSLALRVEEARAAIDAIRPRQLLGAVSMSMGGYVAVRLSQVVSLNALVMIAPAMYDDEQHGNEADAEQDLRHSTRTPTKAENAIDRRPVTMKAMPRPCKPSGTLA